MAQPDLKELAKLTSREEQLAWVRTLQTDQVLEFLLQLHETQARTRGYGKTYRERQKALAKLAMQYLDKDEIEAVRRQAQERVEY